MMVCAGFCSLSPALSHTLCGWFTQQLGKLSKEFLCLQRTWLINLSTQKHVVESSFTCTTALMQSKDLLHESPHSFTTANAAAAAGYPLIIHEHSRGFSVVNKFGKCLGAHSRRGSRRKDKGRGRNSENDVRLRTHKEWLLFLIFVEQI